jgi:cytoskeleton protein RodZ
MGVSVRHNSRLAALIAVLAAVMTVAWFSRALQTESVVDWLFCLVVASVALVQLLVVRDGRAPLMVADEHGVRVRHGETWSGLRWQDIEHVEVQSPGSWMRDGQIVVHPRVLTAEETRVRDAAEDASDSGVDEAVGEDGHGSVTTATRAAAGEAYVVPLARTTRVDFDGLTGDLIADLDALARGRVPVLVLTRIEQELPEQAPRAEPAEHQDGPERVEKPERVRSERGRWAGLLAKTEAVEHADEVDEVHEVEEVDAEAAPEVVTAETPEPEEDTEPEFDPVDPARETRPAARSEVVRDSVRMLSNSSAIPVQRSGDGPVVVARVDDFMVPAPKPATDALIGPLIAAARNRARLSIDVLSERTRIRPHVLECIEVDDFEACGGDFYARGHLRTLARVFGLDPQQLLDLYDDHYAKAEIEARQVFEAELATGIGGGVRAAYTGPRWSLLAACVLALACVWGVARIFNDTPQELVSPAPSVVDSAGLAKADPGGTPQMTLATLEVSAVSATPQVVVRDRDGRILWAGKLAQSQHQQVVGLAPFDVTASNGAAVKVSFLGKAKGTVGSTQAAASRRFG